MRENMQKWMQLNLFYSSSPFYGIQFFLLLSYCVSERRNKEKNIKWNKWVTYFYWISICADACL